MLKRFIQSNKRMWQDFQMQQPSGKKVLIAEGRSPRSIHGSGINSILLKLAKGYDPVWLAEFDEDHMDLIRSYVPTATATPPAMLSPLDKMYINVITVFHYILVKLNFKIIRLRFRGVQYGDLLYDQYLRRYSLATIHKIDKRIFLLIKSFIHLGIRYDRVIKNGGYDAVLTIHRIGRTPGLVIRLAAKYNIDVYTNRSEYYSTLYRTTTVEDVISYQYQPLVSEIDELLARDNFDDLFDQFMNRHLEGDFNKDAAKAYAGNFDDQLDKNGFCLKHGLDPDKKLAFVMMHAFTDFPHSHFSEEMIFSDYYDWFKQTLDYAKTDDSVNWVFKQHPSIEFYPAKDIDCDKLFHNSPEHVKYLDEKQQLNAFGVAKVADAVITCLGSAGFEIPALGTCYAITPSPNHYNDFPFTFHPTSKKDYFARLGKIHSSQPLSPEKKRVAKAVFMFINKYSKVKTTAIPNLTFAQFQDTNMEEWYWDMVLEQYQSKEDIIKEEFLDYTERLKDPDFRAFRSI